MSLLVFSARNAHVEMTALHVEMKGLHLHKLFRTLFLHPSLTDVVWNIRNISLNICKWTRRGILQEEEKVQVNRVHCRYKTRGCYLITVLRDSVVLFRSSNCAGLLSLHLNFILLYCM